MRDWWVTWMNLSDHPQVLAAAILETGLLVGAMAVGGSMRRLGVNGPCRMCLSLLLVWRASTAATIQLHELNIGYFTGLAFAYVFLYATHHLAALVWELRRRRAAGSQPERSQRRPACGV